MSRLMIINLLFFGTAAFTQNVTPGRRILRMKLNSLLNPKKSKAGQKITASARAEAPNLRALASRMEVD